MAKWRKWSFQTAAPVVMLQVHCHQNCSDRSHTTTCLLLQTSAADILEGIFEIINTTGAQADIAASQRKMLLTSKLLCTTVPLMWPQKETVKLFQISLIKNRAMQSLCPEASASMCLCVRSEASACEFCWLQSLRPVQN